MLFDRGGAIPAVHLFDVGGHGDRGNLCEREPAHVAPGEEPRHRRGVRRARVRVADLGGKKLHRPLRGLRPGAPDDVWEALDLPAPWHDERLRRRQGRRGWGSRPCRIRAHLHLRFGRATAASACPRPQSSRSYRWSRFGEIAPWCPRTSAWWAPGCWCRRCRRPWGWARH